jgi:hypothetical protein
MLDRMNIHLLLSADRLPLESERCWRLALAICELVTNAVACKKHGRPDESHLRHDIDFVRPGLSPDAARAARQSRGCRAPYQSRPSIKGDAFSLPRQSSASGRNRSLLSRRSEPKATHNASKDSCHPVRERVARRRHHSTRCCTGAVRPSSGSSAYARWSSSRGWSLGRTCRWPCACGPSGRAQLACQDKFGT